jgi:hypothetical protein
MSQFTSAAFTGALIAAGVKISMDGRGRWIDNVFVAMPTAARPRPGSALETASHPTIGSGFRAVGA